jgi:hypothetical protein
MFEDSQDSANPYVLRVAIVRTALVALLARIIGYDGEISGWTAQPGRPFEPASEHWWKLGENSAQAANTVYDVVREVPGLNAQRDESSAPAR